MSVSKAGPRGELCLFRREASCADGRSAPQGIPNKGKLLTALSLFWFDFLSKQPETKHIPNHVITSDLSQMPNEVQQYRSQLEGRSIWVRRAQVLPVEAIVRGYITGEKSVWGLLAWHGFTESFGGFGW